MFDKIYDDIDRIFPDGLASVRLNGKWGFVDTTGSEVIPCKYDYAYGFFEGFAKVELDDKWGFIDTTGREVIPCIYNFVGSFEDGFALVRLNGKWGYIDKHGNWYDKRPSVLPESITKITISDIRYMVNECINRLI